MISTINPELFPGFSRFKRIGNGSYGIIYRAVHNKTSAQIAIKTVDKINLMTETNRSILASEIHVYEKIDHPYMTHFYGHLEDHAGVYLVLENVSKGTLLDEIVRKTRIKEVEAHKIFCELISAIRYLHEDAKVIHRDIKPENILIDENNDIRLIDFGLSEKMYRKDTFDEKCGSLPYSAPEMLKGQRYTKAIDIWSAGVTLYAMVTGTQPFYGESTKDVYTKIAFYNPPYPSYLSPNMIDLLSRMLKKNPEERITLEEITQHPWIESSRYYYVVQPQFMENNKYKIVPHTEEDINKDIVQRIHSIGIDTSNIVSDILSGKVTECSILYKYFAKQDLMMKLRSPNEIRNMFSAKKINERRGKSFENFNLTKQIKTRKSQMWINTKDIKVPFNKNKTDGSPKLPRLSPITKKNVFI